MRVLSQPSTAKCNLKIAIKQKAQYLIHQGFAKSGQAFRNWLELPNLLDRYQTEAAQALQAGEFTAWERGAFKAAAIDHQQAVVGWVRQACEFFDRPCPAQLLVSFPPAPSVMSPETPTQSKSTDLSATAIATGLGWVLGGPVGGAIFGGASYLLGKTSDSDRSTAPAANTVESPHLEAVREYLTNFSALNLAALEHYEQAAKRVIQFDRSEEPIEETAQTHQFVLLQSTFDRLV